MSTDRCELTACTSPEALDGMRLREMARLKIHHGNGVFLNPFAQEHYGSPLVMIKWKLFCKNPYRPRYRMERVKPVSIDWRKVKNHAGLSITFIKHACVMIRDRGCTFLIDPIFFGLPGPIRDFTPLAFDLDEIPVPHYILITHGHFDHLDRRSVSRFAGKSRIVTPLGYADIVGHYGNHAEMDWFDAFSDGKREIVFLPANHWSMRNPLKGPNTMLWGSYLIRTASGATIYLSGDSAYFPHYTDIGREYKIDLAIFNLGAYEPRWFMGKAHMNPAEVLQAFTELKARQLMIVHWGTFRLGDEPVYLPPDDMRRVMATAERSEALIHLDHGETLFYC